MRVLLDITQAWLAAVFVFIEAVIVLASMCKKADRQPFCCIAS